jgi:4-hydroxy-tetrahydrodipicolinate synthase
LVDTMDVIHHVYPIVSKYFLQKRGFELSTFTRRSVGSFTPAVANEVDGLFAAYSKLKNDLELTSV